MRDRLVIAVQAPAGRDSSIHFNLAESRYFIGSRRERDTITHDTDGETRAVKQLAAAVAASARECFRIIVR